MCSYLTSTTALTGSGKGAAGWFRLGSAMAYFDHPYHSAEEHTLNIDFLNEAEGPSARLAVELTADSARALVRCIEDALAAAGCAGDEAGGNEAGGAVAGSGTGRATAPLPGPTSPAREGLPSKLA